MQCKLENAGPVVANVGIRRRARRRRMRTALRRLCVYFPSIGSGQVVWPARSYYSGRSKEMCGGCVNCDGFLLYLCRCQCETSTCRRPDPGGYWEMGEQQALCAG